MVVSPTKASFTQNLLKYETPPKKGVVSRFNDDANLNGVMHSLEKQLTGSRYVNTNATIIAANANTGTTTGPLFAKQGDSNKKDGGQSVSLFNIPSHHASSPFTNQAATSNQKLDSKKPTQANPQATPSFNGQGFVNQLSFTPR